MIAGIQLKLNLDSPEDYRLFLKVRSLPRYAFEGRTAIVPEEYVSRLGIDVGEAGAADEYIPEPFLFDYQGAIGGLAVRKRKFAVFARCGLGKCNISLSYARHVASILSENRCILIVCPLMVVSQTVKEAARFLGDALPIEQVRTKDLQSWLLSGTAKIGITNYEAMRAIRDRESRQKTLFDSLAESHP